MRTVDFVMIHAQATGQREVWGDPPLIFSEKCPLLDRELFVQACTTARVLICERAFDKLAAGYERVVAIKLERSGELAVQCRVTDMR